MEETPALKWTLSGEEVELAVEGFAGFRATYQGEGYYDEHSQGDPQEQDLYEVEILDASTDEGDWWEDEGEEREQYQDLGLRTSSYHLLLPAGRTTEEDGEESDPLRYVKQYLLVLAYRFHSAVPERRAQILEESTGWTADLLEEAYAGLPPEWQALEVEGEWD